MTALAMAYDGSLEALPPEDHQSTRLFEARGATVSWARWDAPDTTWDRFDAVVVRSCYGYHTRLPAFLAWLGGVRRCVNPLPLICWNADKRYLRDLAARGFAVVPTVWLNRGTPADLATIMDDHGWNDVVVKPTISASAMHTRRIARAEAATEQRWFATTQMERALMVQPFVAEVCTIGEWSLSFFAGAFSHAVLKTPRPGDFRVQSEHGGAFVHRSPPRVVRDVAERLVSDLPQQPAYARVDGVVTETGFWIMELELIEPHLFLATEEGAANRYADAVWRCVHG